MLTRRFVLALFAAVLATAIAVPATHAGAPLTRLNRLTFQSPVSLPGVVLTPGTYVFESGPVNTHPDIVRVTSQDHQKIFYQGFTGRLSRPARMPSKEVISLGEAPAGAPVPIAAWYPLGTNIGHQFRY